MYFLNTLVFLSSTLTVAHDSPHTTTAPTCNAFTSSLSTSQPHARSTKTVIVTVTHTFSPSNRPEVSPSKTSSHFAIPSSVTEGIQAGVFRLASVAGPIPLTTELQTATNGTRLPRFTLRDPSASATSVPFVGHHTIPSSSPPYSGYPDSSPLSKSSAVDSNTMISSLFVSHYAPDSTTSKTAGSSAPSTTPFVPTYQVPEYAAPAPPLWSTDAGIAMSMLSVGSAGPVESLSAFDWPGTASVSAPSLPSAMPDGSEQDDENGKNYNGSDGDGNGTAWAGVDNAIPAQMHDHSLQGRTLARLSPPPLQSKSAAVRRVGRIWARYRGFSEEAKSGKGKEDVEEGVRDDKRGEQGQCQPCGEEGKSTCRGDIAIGICKSGCVEMQFLGRERGNGCEDDGAIG